jgi:stage V sporulation protein G
MEITEVRIKLMEDSDDRLQAFCSITFDDAFVVRDLKIIDGTNGPFVAMPSRKLTNHCHQCGSKNHMKAAYCNQCGARQRDDRTLRDSEGRAKLYADIAHPINSACREMIQNRVIAEFRVEQERAKQPGYVSRYDDDYDDDVDPQALSQQNDRRAAQASAPSAATPASSTQIEPAQSQPPPPHILPKEQPAAGSAPGAATTPSQGGPHFTNPLPKSETVKESPGGSTKGKRRGDFGAGIF